MLSARYNGDCVDKPHGEAEANKIQQMNSFFDSSEGTESNIRVIGFLFGQAEHISLNLRPYCLGLNMKKNSF